MEEREKTAQIRTNIGTGILRGEGDMKRAMYAMIVGSGLDKLSGSRRSSVKSAKVVCIEVFNKRSLFTNNISGANLPLLNG